MISSVAIGARPIYVVFQNHCRRLYSVDLITRARYAFTTAALKKGIGISRQVPAGTVDSGTVVPF